MEDEEVPKRKAITLGDPIGHLSVHELEELVALLRQEIGRAEQEISKKRDVMGAAEALFKQPAKS